MTTKPSELLCEILCPRAKSQQKADIFSTFETIFAISNEAAAEIQSQPSYGLKVYGNVTAHPDDAGLFLFWKSMEHHDRLSAAPGFAPAAKMFGDKIVPNLETPLDPCYFVTRNCEAALGDAACCEVIEIQCSSSGGAGQVEKNVAIAFDGMSTPRDFLGFFCGPKHDDSKTVVVVTKWGSKAVIDSNAWIEESERRLLGVLGGGSSIKKRQQMYV